MTTSIAGGVMFEQGGISGSVYIKASGGSIQITGSPLRDPRAKTEILTHGKFESITRDIEVLRFFIEGSYYTPTFEDIRIFNQEIKQLLSDTLTRNALCKEIALDIYDGKIETDSNFVEVALSQGIFGGSRITELSHLKGPISPKYVFEVPTTHRAVESLKEAFSLPNVFQNLFLRMVKSFCVLENFIRLPTNRLYGSTRESEDNEINRIKSLEDLDEIAFNLNLSTLYRSEPGEIDKKTIILDPKYLISDYFINNTNTVIVRTK